MLKAPSPAKECHVVGILFVTIAYIGENAYLKVKTIFTKHCLGLA
jgi:hypothetical protein